MGGGRLLQFRLMNVVRFPPLPEIPVPPRSERDARQKRAEHVIGALADALGMPDAYAGKIVGFRASAVDVGALQDMIERAIAAFDMGQVRDRW